MIPIVTPSGHALPARPCLACEHWAGWLNRINSRCARPDGVPVMAAPAHGCAFWVRLPGCDDEPVRAEE